MNKLDRKIDEMRMNISKERTMGFVMNEIKEIPKKRFSFNFRKYKAVPLFVFTVAISLVIVLSNDFTVGPVPIPDPGNPLLDIANSENLAELSYITGSLVLSNFTLEANPGLLKLADLNENEFEVNILEFNAYFYMLRVFMDDKVFD